MTAAQPSITEDEFEAEARAFLDAHLDRRPLERFEWGRGSDDVSLFPERTAAEEAAELEAAKSWARIAFDAGFGWISGPEAYGGRGLPRSYQRRYQSVAAGYSMPSMSPFGIGLGMVAPTIAAHATEPVRLANLGPMHRGDIVGCQLFSEPGAGSDLASLQTRAERDGDEWIVNGQKVWTSGAQFSDIGEIICRTDPTLPKHRGLTGFVVDMHAPGVEVRPLRQMTGGASFNEVFFTDVRIPDSHRLGDVNGGWSVALTTLMNERVAIGGGVPGRGSGSIGEAVAAWRRRPGSPVQRDRLMQLWAAAEASRLTNLRARQLRRAGTPGPEGSVSKLMATGLNQRIYELCVDLAGMDGTLSPTGYVMRRPERAGFSNEDPRWSFLRSRANTIEGGTSEIMRNILGERVLGLPGEPRADKDRPWSDVPRN
jgi:alkylation response protein AidB-like acyl-CoA dehydrogenase